LYKTLPLPGITIAEEATEPVESWYTDTVFEKTIRPILTDLSKVAIESSSEAFVA
jgi:hypothetical protein